MGFAGQAAHDDGGDPGVNRGAEIGEGRRGAVHVLDHRLEALGFGPGVAAGEHFEAGDGVREEIDSLVGLLPTGEFGGHVVGLPGAVAGGLEGGSVGDGEAEVDQFEFATRLGDQHIGGAEIAIDELLRVEIGETFPELNDEREAMLLEEVILHIDEEGEPDGVEELHHEELLARGGVPPFEGADDLGVLQAAGDFPLGGLFELGRESRLVLLKFFGVEDFQADHPASAGVASLEEPRHCSLAHPGEQFEAAVQVDAGGLARLAKQILQELHRVGSGRGTGAWSADRRGSIQRAGCDRPAGGVCHPLGTITLAITTAINTAATVTVATVTMVAADLREGVVAAPFSLSDHTERETRDELECPKLRATAGVGMAHGWSATTPQRGPMSRPQAIQRDNSNR